MSGLWVLLVILLLCLAAPVVEAQKCRRKSVQSFNVVCDFVIPGGLVINGVEFGELSGVTAKDGFYFGITDKLNQPRLFTMQLDLTGSKCSMSVIDTCIFDVSPAPDMEGLAFDEDTGDFLVLSEGRTNSRVDPFLRSFSQTCSPEQDEPDFALPPRYLDGSRSDNRSRDNRGLVGLTILPNGDTAHVGTEYSLNSDFEGSNIRPSRILGLDMESRAPNGQEYVYVNDDRDDIAGLQWGINGLVELLAIDNSGTLLVLERASSSGRWNNRLYEVFLKSGANVFDVDVLQSSDFDLDAHAVEKKLIADLGNDFDLDPINLEGMTFLTTADENANNQRILFVGDNELNPSIDSHFVLAEITFRDDVSSIAEQAAGLSKSAAFYPLSSAAQKAARQVAKLARKKSKFSNAAKQAKKFVRNCEVEPVCQRLLVPMAETIQECLQGEDDGGGGGGGGDSPTQCPKCTCDEL